jgi:hypothetical protein
LFLSFEMSANLLLEDLPHFSLESLDIHLPCLNGPIDSYAQGERVLVLMGKRN